METEVVGTVVENVDVKPAKMSKSTMVKMTAEEWVARINVLDDPAMRGKIASIVLWDFFGHCVGGAPKVIKDLAATYQSIIEFAPDQLAQGLMSVGYPENVALKCANASRQVYTVNDAEDNQNNGLRDVGEASVVATVCQMAVEDVKTLIASGVVRSNGTINPSWPPKVTNGVVGYKTRSEVSQLLNWVTKGGLLDEMEALGLDFNMDEVLEAIGLDVRKVA